MSDVPSWAALLGDRYPAFRRVVVAELARLEIPIDDDALACGVVVARDARYGLTNVMRLCHAADEERWPQIVADHFRRCTQRAADISAFEREVEHLRIRLVPERHVFDGRQLVTRRLADGLHAAVAIDFADSVRFVMQRDREAWQCSEDELFELAAANTRAEPELQRVDHELADGTTITMLVGDSYYAASHVLFLGRYFASSSRGHLVAVPDRHCVLVAPLVIPALEPLVRVTAARFESEPGALTGDLYWRRPTGEMLAVPCRIEDDKLCIQCPPELVHALGALDA